MKLKKDIEKLKLQNIEKKEANINNFVNNNSNNKITININNYGDEKNFLKKSLIKKILEMPFNGIPELIEKIHFNNEYPENKNIRLLNKKDNKLQIMKDKKWNYVNKNETFKNLIEDKNSIMENLYKKNQHKLNDKFRNRYLNFQKKFDEEDLLLWKDILMQTELVFWNNM